jgi:hypothetical protein
MASDSGDGSMMATLETLERIFELASQETKVMNHKLVLLSEPPKKLL